MEILHHLSSIIVCIVIRWNGEATPLKASLAPPIPLFILLPIILPPFGCTNSRAVPFPALTKHLLKGGKKSSSAPLSLHGNSAWGAEFGSGLLGQKRGASAGRLLLWSHTLLETKQEKGKKQPVNSNVLAVSHTDFLSGVLGFLSWDTFQSGVVRKRAGNPGVLQKCALPAQKRGQTVPPRCQFQRANWLAVTGLEWRMLVNPSYRGNSRADRQTAGCEDKEGSRSATMQQGVLEEGCQVVSAEGTKEGFNASHMMLCAPTAYIWPSSAHWSDSHAQLMNICGSFLLLFGEKKEKLTPLKGHTLPKCFFFLQVFSFLFFYSNRFFFQFDPNLFAAFDK